MFEDHNNAIYDIMLSSGLLTKPQLEEFDETHVNTGKPLADVILDSGLVDKDTMLKAIAKDLQYEYMPIPPADIPEDAIKQLRANMARTYGVVPLRFDDTTITLIAKDPFNNAIIDDLTFSLNKDVSLIVMDPDKVDSLIVQSYGEDNLSIDDILSEIKDDDLEGDGASKANRGSAAIHWITVH